MILIDEINLLDLAAKSTLSDETTLNVYKAIDYAVNKRHFEIKDYFLYNDSEFNYLNKGTVGYLKMKLKEVSEDMNIIEWFDYQGSLYYFKVSTGKTFSSLKDYENLFLKIENNKNVRSWLEKIEINKNYKINKNILFIEKRKKQNYINMRDFELPFFDKKLNTGMVFVTTKINNI